MFHVSDIDTTSLSKHTPWQKHCLDYMGWVIWSWPILDSTWGASQDLYVINHWCQVFPSWVGKNITVKKPHSHYTTALSSLIKSAKTPWAPYISPVTAVKVPQKPFGNQPWQWNIHHLVLGFPSHVWVPEGTSIVYGLNYGGWVRNPAPPKGWFFNPINNGMCTIYQLVQDFATIHSILNSHRKNILASPPHHFEKKTCFRWKLIYPGLWEWHIGHISENSLAHEPNEFFFARFKWLLPIRNTDFLVI